MDPIRVESAILPELTLFDFIYYDEEQEKKAKEVKVTDPFLRISNEVSFKFYERDGININRFPPGYRFVSGLKKGFKSGREALNDSISLAKLLKSDTIFLLESYSIDDTVFRCTFWSKTDTINYSYFFPNNFLRVYKRKPYPYDDKFIDLVSKWDTAKIRRIAFSVDEQGKSPLNRSIIYAYKVTNTDPLQVESAILPELNFLDLIYYKKEQEKRTKKAIEK